MGDGPQSASHYETLVNASDDILWIFSSDWTECSFVNDRYEEVWGRPVDRLRQAPRDFLNGVHPADRDQVKDHMERAAQGESVDLEFRVNPEENYTRWVWAKGKPIRDEDGTVTRVAGLSREVTERKRSEQELERQRDRLDEFTGLVSHDLRTPLQAAMGYLELAQADVESEHLDKVATNLERMEALIDDLLTLARQGDKTQDIETVDLATCVEECWERVAGSDASLETSIDQTVQADRRQLQRLLENLFENAVDHGGPEVTVSVGSTPTGFYIADDGDGFDVEARHQAFEAGYTTAAEGTGFGLNIVDQVATTHDWEVDLSDSADGGARVDITVADTRDME